MFRSRRSRPQCCQSKVHWRDDFRVHLYIPMQHTGKWTFFVMKILRFLSCCSSMQNYPPLHLRVSSCAPISVPCLFVCSLLFLNDFHGPMEKKEKRFGRQKYKTHRLNRFITHHRFSVHFWLSPFFILLKINYYLNRLTVLHKKTCVILLRRSPLCLVLLVHRGGYTVNLYSFYFSRIIGKLTTFLKLQEFSIRKLPVDTSTFVSRRSSHI